MTATSEVRMLSKQRNLTTRTARFATAVVALTFAAGCGLFGGGDGGDKGAATPGAAGKGAGATPSAVPRPKPGGPFTSAQLGATSRIRLPKLTPAFRPKHGAYGTLQVADSAIDPQDLGSEVTVSPARCKDAIWAGPSKRTFAKAPAAFQMFLDPEADDAGKSGVVVWNTLIASAGTDPKAALGRQPRGCDTVRVRSKGESATLTARAAPRLGTPSRAAIFAGSDSPRTWIVTYTGNGYIGSVMVQGPVEQAQVEAIVTQAHRQAKQVLG